MVNEDFNRFNCHLVPVMGDLRDKGRGESEYEALISESIGEISELEGKTSAVDLTTDYGLNVRYAVSAIILFLVGLLLLNITVYFYFKGEIGQNVIAPDLANSQLFQDLERSPQSLRAKQAGKAVVDFVLQLNVADNILAKKEFIANLHAELSKTNEDQLLMQNLTDETIFIAGGRAAPR